MILILRVRGPNLLVTLRFFHSAIVVPNVQYFSRIVTLYTTVRMVKNNSSVLMHGHAIVGQLIRRLIIIQKPFKKLSSTADCSFISSLAVDGFTMHVIE